METIATPTSGSMHQRELSTSASLGTFTRLGSDSGVATTIAGSTSVEDASSGVGVSLSLETSVVAEGDTTTLVAPAQVTSGVGPDSTSVDDTSSYIDVARASSMPFEATGHDGTASKPEVKHNADGTTSEHLDRDADIETGHRHQRQESRARLDQTIKAAEEDFTARTKMLQLPDGPLDNGEDLLDMGEVQDAMTKLAAARAELVALAAQSSELNAQL